MAQTPGSSPGQLSISDGEQYGYLAVAACPAAIMRSEETDSLCFSQSTEGPAHAGHAMQPRSKPKKTMVSFGPISGGGTVAGGPAAAAQPYSRPPTVKKNEAKSGNKAKSGSKRAPREALCDDVPEDGTGTVISAPSGSSADEGPNKA